MLVYHPAFDVDHACFRALELLELHQDHAMSVDQLRILDFYFVFPHLLANARLLPAHKGIKSKLLKRRNDYNHVADPRALMREMRGVQQAALGSLAARRMIDVESLRENMAKRTSRALPAPVQRLIDDQPTEDAEIAQFLARDLSSLPLNGQNGLKARTGLVEHRYDPG
jgi:hypothetical protein